MPIQKNANFEQHMQSEDLVLRDSFQVVHDNTDNLQNQIDRIVAIITDSNNTTLAAVKTALSNEFSWTVMYSKLSELSTVNNLRSKFL